MTVQWDFFFTLPLFIFFSLASCSFFPLLIFMVVESLHIWSQELKYFSLTPTATPVTLSHAINANLTHLLQCVWTVITQMCSRTATAATFWQKEGKAQRECHADVALILIARGGSLNEHTSLSKKLQICYFFFDHVFYIVKN